MQKKGKILFIVAFLLFGTNFLSQGFSSFMVAQTYQEASGKVVGDTQNSRQDPQRICTPILEFSVKSEKVTVNTNWANHCSFYLGEAVKLLYDPKNPQNIEAYYSPVETYPEIFFGLFFTLFGSIIFITNLRHELFIRKMKKTGQAIEAKITAIKPAQHGDFLTVRGKRQILYRIFAEYREKNITHQFQSDLLTFEPSPSLQGSPIKVYVDPHNFQKYYVDTETIKNNSGLFSG